MPAAGNYMAEETPVTQSGVVPVDVQFSTGITRNSPLYTYVERDSFSIAVSVAALAANGVYTSASFGGDPNRPLLNVDVGSDQAGTLFMDMLINGVWYPYGAGVAVAAASAVHTQYTIGTGGTFRLRYVNGATAQTGFGLYAWQAS